MSNNPQHEHGHLKIATGKRENDIVLALCGSGLSGVEWDLVMFTMRMTWGYHKKTNWISLSKYIKGTRRSKSGVIESLKSLIDKKILLKSGSTWKPEYGINKHFSEWSTSTPQRTSTLERTCTPQRTSTSTLERTGASTLERTYKRKLLKGKLLKQEREEPSAPPLSQDASLPDGRSPAGGEGVGNTVGGRPATGAAAMFARFTEITGKKVTVISKVRLGHMKARLQDFSEADLELAWAAMAKDRSLRGDNKTGVDYLTIEYALKVQYVERYLDKAKSKWVNVDGKVTPKKPQVELPPVRITRKDGSIVDEYPDGRCVVVTPRS